MKTKGITSLPNGRILMNCSKCTHQHELKKWGWRRTTCSMCNNLIENPIVEVSDLPKRKTSIMITEEAELLIKSISAIQEVPTTKAFEAILFYAIQEFRYAGNHFVEKDFEEAESKDSKKRIRKKKVMK